MKKTLFLIGIIFLSFIGLCFAQDENNSGVIASVSEIQVTSTLPTTYTGTPTYYVPSNQISPTTIALILAVVFAGAVFFYVFIYKKKKHPFKGKEKAPVWGYNSFLIYAGDGGHGFASGINEGEEIEGKWSAKLVDGTELAALEPPGSQDPDVKHIDDLGSFVGTKNLWFSKVDKNNVRHNWNFGIIESHEAIFERAKESVWNEVEQDFLRKASQRDIAKTDKESDIKKTEFVESEERQER